MSKYFIMTKLQESFHLNEQLIRTITECSDLTNSSSSIEDLLEQGAEVNTLHGTLLPLHCACMCSDHATADLLISRGAKVNALDGYGRAAIHYAAERDVTCLELLIAENADVNIRDGNQDTPLHWAVFKNKAQNVRILLQNGCLVNSQDYNFDTPLSWAAQSGSLEPMKILLEYNCRIDTFNLNGNCPLYRSAVMNASGLGDDNDESCLELLLRASGQFDLRNKDGIFPPIMQRDNRIREMLLPMCRNSRKLQQLCRYMVRRYLGIQYMPNSICQLPVPKRIQQYLLLQS